MYTSLWKQTLFCLLVPVNFSQWLELMLDVESRDPNQSFSYTAETRNARFLSNTTKRSIFHVSELSHRL